VWVFYSETTCVYRGFSESDRAYKQICFNTGIKIQSFSESVASSLRPLFDTGKDRKMMKSFFEREGKSKHFYSAKNKFFMFVNIFYFWNFGGL
jgi:hypothetical protein